MDEMINQTAESLKNAVLAVEKPLEHFNRYEYTENLQHIKAGHPEMIQMLDQIYALGGEENEILRETAKRFTRLMQDYFSQIKGKIKRGTIRDECNLILTAYLFPLILDTEPEQEKSAEYLANEIAACWKAAFPKTALTPAKADVIAGGFHKSIPDWLRR